MKKIIASLFMVFFMNTLSAQVISQDELIGTWKVVNVLNQETNVNLIELMKGFETATFQFTAQHEFNLSSSVSNEVFTRFSDMTKNSYWRLNPEKQILIGNSENNYSVIKIGNHFENGKTIFTFEETPIKLEVQKK